MIFDFSHHEMSHKLVILDEIMSQLEAATSGIDPGTVKQAKVSGIQNVPTAISQKTIGGASSTCYTTFPLSPLADCCNIDKSYLYLDFEVNLGLLLKPSAKTSAGATIPIYFGFRDTSSLFSQIQFLIEGSTIWQTVYQREESVIAYNSLPEEEIETNEQYSSIDKMRLNLESPMYRIEIPVSEIDTTNTNPVNFKVNFKLTVDINRLTPLLSNLHYTTMHMGNLRLKVFIQELEKALFFCPDYSAFDNDCAVKKNQYWQFYPLNNFFNDNLKDKIPFVVLDSGTTPKILEATDIRFVSSSANLDFFTFERGTAEIIQTTFAIKPSEWDRLTDYFTSLGSVIIPTNVWSTNVFNNSNLPLGQWNTTMIGNVSGYNIDTISIWTHPLGNPCCMTKEYLTGIQALLEGRPINPVPYECYNGEFITDMSQAIADTDVCSVNKDYMRSLTLFNRKNGEYYTKAVVQADKSTTWFPTLATATGVRQDHIGVPNTFVMNFNTNLPDAFHSGACVIENTGKQSVLRFISTNKFLGSDKYPYIINGHNSPLVVGFSCLCDACIVLSFDPARRTCFTGQLSWAAPYTEQGM